MGHKPDRRARKKRREREALAGKTKKKPPDLVDRWLTQCLKRVEKACRERQRSAEIVLAETTGTSWSDVPAKLRKAAEETRDSLRADVTFQVECDVKSGQATPSGSAIVIYIRW